MQGVSEIVKTYSGRWLAHNRLPLAAKAFVGADLVTGERQFVRPTVCRAADLARVNVAYVCWALRRRDNRPAIEAGAIPLVPPPALALPKPMETASDPERDHPPCRSGTYVQGARGGALVLHDGVARVRASNAFFMEEMILTDLTELLGGAQRGRTGVRAFTTWSPREETLALLARVNAGEQPKLLITTIFPLDPSPSNAVAAP